MKRWKELLRLSGIGIICGLIGAYLSDRGQYARGYTDGLTHHVEVTRTNENACVIADEFSHSTLCKLMLSAPARYSAPSAGSRSRQSALTPTLPALSGAGTMIDRRCKANGGRVITKFYCEENRP